MIAQIILSFIIIIPPWKYNLILFNVSCCLCCSNTTTTTFRILQYSLCPFVFNWWMGETRIKKNEKLLKGWRRSNKGLERKAEDAHGVLGPRSRRMQFVATSFIQQILCRNMDELIWQVDPVREHNSAEIAHK